MARELLDKTHHFLILQRMTNFTIDIISTGSKTNLLLLEGQASALSMHPSVRYFFGLTEDDDADPTCAERLTYETMTQISEHCVSKQIRRRNRLVES